MTEHVCDESGVTLRFFVGLTVSRICCRIHIATDDHEIDLSVDQARALLRPFLFRQLTQEYGGGDEPVIVPEGEPPDPPKG